MMTHIVLGGFLFDFGNRSVEGFLEFLEARFELFFEFFIGALDLVHASWSCPYFGAVRR